MAGSTRYTRMCLGQATCAGVVTDYRQSNVEIGESYQTTYRCDLSKFSLD